MKIHEYNEMMAYLTRPARKGFEPGGPVRKSELTKVLADVGITPSKSNFSKVMKDLDIKKDTKHPLHRKTQPIYIEPTKKELIIKKKKWDKNQLLSFHTGPGREAYELREKRIIELLNQGDLTLSEIDDIIKTEFGTSSKTTITKLKKDLKIKLPSARERGIKNPKTAKIIKDLNILKNSDELNNFILKPDFNLIRDIPKLEEIASRALPKSDAEPIRRVGQLMLAYSGEDPELQKYVGKVSDNLVKASNVVKTKMNKSSRLLSTLQKIASEKRAAGELGKAPGFFGSQRKRLNEIVNSFRKGLNIQVDEVKAIGGARAKTAPYNLFVQGIKDTVNEYKGQTLDRLTQDAEINLQNAKTKADKIKIANKYNKEVKDFVKNVNKSLKPGQLPVKAFEISFDKPSDTIKNKKAYTQYKKSFDKIHADHGYSFKVPKDVMTSEQAKTFLKTKKGKAQLLKQANLGSQRLYANMVPGLETLIKTVSSMPDDFRAKRYWTLGLKGLGITAVPLVAYDGYTAIRDGLPPDEVVAKALLGADKLLYKGKEVLQLTPEEREARSVVKQEKLKELNEDQMMGFGFIEGPEVDSDLTLDEAEAKLKEGQDRYADFREERDAARASERAGIAKSIKDRIYGVPLEEITDQVYNQGGRVGFDEGSKPKNPSRRAFLKGITALAALPLVGKYFKLGKVLERASTYTGPAIDKVKGMPEWFPSLVKKLWNEGEDATKSMAFKERQIVKKGTLEGGDDVYMTYDLDSGNVSIEVGTIKGTSTKSGAYNKEYGLDYTKGEVLEETGKKTSDDFGVIELEGRTTPDAADIDWDINPTTVDDAMSDLTELEAFAKNKTTKQIHKKKGTKPKDVFPDYDPGDYDID